jgi:hypothetical protein
MVGAARLTAHGSGGGPLLVGAAGAATPGGGPGVLVAVFELTAGACGVLATVESPQPQAGQHRGDGHGSRQTCQSPGMTSRHDKVATPSAHCAAIATPGVAGVAACPALRTSRPLNFMDDGPL